MENDELVMSVRPTLLQAEYNINDVEYYGGQVREINVIYSSFKIKHLPWLAKI